MVCLVLISCLVCDLCWVRLIIGGCCWGCICVVWVFILEVVLLVCWVIMLFVLFLLISGVVKEKVWWMLGFFVVWFWMD